MKSGKKLYLECYSGISGDMTVAALLDLGVDEKVLTEALESLPVPGFSIEIKRVAKSGIDACDFNVILDAAHENHDHDMSYLHGHAHHHSHEHGENQSIAVGILKNIFLRRKKKADIVLTMSITIAMKKNMAAIITMMVTAMTTIIPIIMRIEVCQRFVRLSIREK